MWGSSCMADSSVWMEFPSFTSPTQGEDQWGWGYLLDSRGHCFSHCHFLVLGRSAPTWGRIGYSQLWGGVPVVARDQGSLHPSLAVLLPQPAWHAVAMPGLVEGWLGVILGKGD